MKVALALLLGAVFVVASQADCGPAVYKCEKSYEHCKKVDECEDPKKVACGDDWCKYPEVCKYVEKKVCKDVPSIKKVCGVEKKVCKEVLTKCGKDKCKFDEECVKTKVCHPEVLPFGKSKASASASAVAVSSGGPAQASASAVATGGRTYGPVDICEEILICVPKDPCKVVIEPKCAAETLKEDEDYSGYSLVWDPLWKVGNTCGKGVCKPGYKCAFVKSKVCPEGVKCGDETCDLGFECVDDVDCKEIKVVENVCKKEKYPVCVLDDDWTSYLPVCKKVWKCDGYVPCGPGHCDPGYACKVVKPRCPKRGGDDDDGDDDGGDDDDGGEGDD